MGFIQLTTFPQKYARFVRKLCNLPRFYQKNDYFFKKKINSLKLGAVSQNKNTVQVLLVTSSMSEVIEIWISFRCGWYDWTKSYATSDGKGNIEKKKQPFREWTNRTVHETRPNSLFLLFYLSSGVRVKL